MDIPEAKEMGFHSKCILVEHLDSAQVFPIFLHTLEENSNMLRGYLTLKPLTNSWKMSRHPSHVHPIFVPSNLTCNIKQNTSKINYKLSNSMSYTKPNHAYQPSAFTTSGFFLKRRRRHNAAFFLTSGRQLLEI